MGLEGLAISQRGVKSDSLGVVDAELEASRAPLDQVERGLRLERSSRSRAVPRNNIAAVQESDGHVLAVARIADHHLVVRFEAFHDQHQFIGAAQVYNQNRSDAQTYTGTSSRRP